MLTGGAAAATRTLPRDVASFTGRDAELGQLVRAVAAVEGSGGVVGIYAIGGMAGIGKTAFAVNAAHQLAEWFPDGQIFLPLHGHTPGQEPVDPADALASLLQTSGIPPSRIPAGLEARTRLWRDHLADKKLLLLLDDAVGHQQVRPLLPGTAGSLVLVTSRRRLTALEGAQAISLDTLPPDEAAHLLVRLAARQDLGSEDAPVREIVRLCGFLPLAVGMLAGQLHHHPAWTAAGLAADLVSARDRLGMMQAENLSVAAAFDLSYQELTPERQQTFRRLGLHPGTDIDAYAAAALNNIDVTIARGHLESLYDQYLLTEPTQGRYRLHDLIRQHARSLAVSDPFDEREAAVDRLLDYYVHAARVADSHLPSRTPAVVPAATFVPPTYAPDLKGQDDAITWMSSDRLNLHSVVGYAATHNRPRHAMAIPAAMHGFLSSQGQWYQARALHQLALNAARHAGDSDAEAGALTDLGDTQHLTGDYPAAIGSLGQALELYRARSDQLGEAGALSLLGDVQYSTGDYSAAATSLTQALELYRHQGDRLGEARVLGLLGDLRQATGDYPEATASLSQALELHRDLRNHLREAVALTYLGRVQYLTGRYPASEASLTRALELHRDLGHRLGEANALTQLGTLQCLTGDYPAASASLTRALELHHDLGHPLGEANALHYLGMVHRLTGEYVTASANLTRALELHRDLSNRIGESEVLNTMGELAHASSSPAEAHALHQEALIIATKIDSPLQEARALEGIARFLQSSHPGHRDALLHKALAIYRRIGSPHAERVVADLRHRDR